MIKWPGPHRFGSGGNDRHSCLSGGFMLGLLLVLAFFTTLLPAQTPKGWSKGKGYGWVYGKDDEVGALNAVTSPASVLRALREVKSGRVYDLGVRIDATSYKWPGHSPTVIMSYRSPEGVKRGKDIEGFG